MLNLNHPFSVGPLSCTFSIQKVSQMSDFSMSNIPEVKYCASVFTSLVSAKFESSCTEICPVLSCPVDQPFVCCKYVKDPIQITEKTSGQHFL